MLTSNQTLLLRRIANATAPVSLEKLANVRNDHGDAMGENAVRNSCKRMESNGWIAGSGAGRLRSYAITAVGESALADPMAATDSSSETNNGTAPDPPATPVETDASPASSRDYIVLEEVRYGDVELDVGDIVFVVVEKTAARNVEAALRHVAKANFEDGTPRLVAVSEKMWQVTPVAVNTTRSVSIGGG